MHRHLGDNNAWAKGANFETTARNTLLWRVPHSMNVGHTARIVEVSRQSEAVLAFIIT